MLKLQSASLSKEPLTLEFETMEITMLLIHIAVPKQASRFATYGMARVKIACISWNLASPLLLTTSVFTLLGLSTDAVKEYNKCKKDIALLVVLISSDCF